MSLNNFGVVDETPLPKRARLYRSAQPDDKGMADLRDLLGITYVFKLNSEAEFPAAKEAAGLGSTCTIHAVEVNQWNPDAEAVTSIVELIDETMKAGYNVLVHCTHGRDRTGLVIGAYRILKNRWTLDATLTEFSSYGAVGLIKLADHEIIELLQNLAKP